ncbi:hypothetical protein NM688_g1683 [Phlebia brevispora]|uniref:Uncharacterized protein n=1 Tax=Phlebia brevispora TaxID=194682 RepID=A0ACC1TAZ4_9APHY|nr:hypothetical protein NM688_g1683 [Phlebia brevispora]
MSGRKLNSLEQKIHQSALSAGDKKITQREVDALAPDIAARTAALNFLLSTGMLKLLKGDDGKLQYRAVVKEELDVKKDLSNEEALVLSHIQAAGTEGIWTKHIKAKTELHQTVIDRCLKSLTQKQLVKALKGTVQHPTRKMYILFHLEPSTEVTGGPWYTDKELDTEFIKLLSAACLKFIRDRSFPRSRSGDGQQRLLYPISAQPPYPTAAQVQSFLNKSRITETQLTVEHVEMLLNVLVIDGEVERVPALGATLWESSFGDEDEDGDSSSNEEEKPKAKKRKRTDEHSKRKKKRRRTESDSESESDSDEKSSKKSKSRSKHRSKKRRRHEHSDEDDSESDEDRGEHKRKKSKKRKSSKETDSESGSETESDSARRKRSKSKGKKRSSSLVSASDSSASDSETESEPVRRSKSSSKSSKSKSKAKKRSSSPAGYVMDDSVAMEGALVYRAVYPERMAHFGLAQAPCGRCPVFDFCKEGGPVNPGECHYYGDWLAAAAVKIE